MRGVAGTTRGRGVGDVARVARETAPQAMRPGPTVRAGKLRGAGGRDGLVDLSSRNVHRKERAPSPLSRAFRSGEK